MCVVKWSKPMAESRVQKPFKVKEYAALARVSPNAIYELVRRGELPTVRFGRAIRIPREAGEKRLLGK
jgi:excisionase family DNA binding protein